MTDVNPTTAYDFKVALVSLGCDKNTVDGEEMLGILTAHGYQLAELPEDADAVIVNTCCFIGDALEESISTLFEIAQLKKEGTLQYLIVTGCMSERYKEQISTEIPEADAFLGTTGFTEIATVLDRLRAGERGIAVFPDVNRVTEESPRRITNRPYTEYLKIAEGCDKKCTYCAIPRFRGAYRSIPMNRLVKTARELAAEGVKELILVAQETTVYGRDIYGEKKLPELLRRLGEIEDLEWIRLLYCYPEEINDELIEAIATEPKVVHYIDMPLQHTETRVLQRMGRILTKEGLFRLVARLRTRIPDIALRTTLIAGFPGETEEEHQALLETLDTLEFDRLGVFTYSKEEGTIAADMPDQLPQETKERYRDEIMELQQEISLDKNESLVGKKFQVLVEGYLPEEDVYVARTYRDAPDVDGMVFLSADRELMSGSMVTARIVGAAEYDLTAELEEDE